MKFLVTQIYCISLYVLYVYLLFIHIIVRFFHLSSPRTNFHPCGDNIISTEKSYIREIDVSLANINIPFTIISMLYQVHPQICIFKGEEGRRGKVLPFPNLGQLSETEFAKDQPTADQ